MSYSLIVSTDEVAHHLDDPAWAIVDCRFSLTDIERGRRDYLDAHIPGAVYAHLDDDLSSSIIPGQTGRHPLPSVDLFAARLVRWGIGNDTQVVVYDDAGGLIAGRLWWMLRWVGHTKAALLDGDWRQWVNEVRPTQSGEETRAPRTFVPRVRPELLASAEELLANLENDGYRLVDARDEQRYRGEVAGLDPIAGHIPGAVSAHYLHNLNEQGKFRSPDELAAYYFDLLGAEDNDELPDEIVVYCGSGVSAAHTLLAMELAGLGQHRLYVGSWSHWIADPTRPIATDK